MDTVTLGIMITTSQRIPRRAVREYLGLVSGEAIGTVQHAQEQRTAPNSIENLATGQSAFQRALREMAQRASELGATVIVGVEIAYVAIRPGALLVSATGTAGRL
jgi:uncharacterized protein YbjQ (UPF0145 family)